MFRGLFNIGGLRIKEVFELDKDRTADMEEVVTWEITVKISGHLRNCKGFFHKCNCIKLHRHDLIKDSCKDIDDFLREAGIAKYIKYVVRVDSRGRSHVFVRCTQYFANLLKNCSSITHIERCRDNGLIRECV